MATINNGIMGGFSGTVGSVVGSQWNGKDTMRGKKTHHKDAQSEAQQDYRARFSTIVKFLKPLKAFLRVGFKNRKKGLSAYNAATSCNMQYAITGTFPQYEIDFSKVMVSQGVLPGALNPVVVAKGAGQIEFSWENNSEKMNAMANDQSILLAYSQEKKTATISFNNSSRIDGKQVLNVENIFTGDTIHCYIAFQNAAQNRISDSRYAGAVKLV